MPLDVAQNTYPRSEIMPSISSYPAVALAVNLVASTTYVAGQAIGELTSTPGTFGPYNSAGADGTQNAVAFLPMACSTDGSGNITLGTNADPAGRTQKATKAWFSGVFQAGDIKKASAVAMDAALAAKFGKLLQGTLTNGVFKLN